MNNFKVWSRGSVRSERTIFRHTTFGAATLPADSSVLVADTVVLIDFERIGVGGEAAFGLGQMQVYG